MELLGPPPVDSRAGLLVSAVDALPYPLAVVDAQLQVRHANAAFTRLVATVTPSPRLQARVTHVLRSGQPDCTTEVSGVDRVRTTTLFPVAPDLVGWMVSDVDAPEAVRPDITRLLVEARGAEVSGPGAREVLGMAQGVLMERAGITAEEAYAVLREASERLRMPLRTLAERVVRGEPLGP